MATNEMLRQQIRFRKAMADRQWALHDERYAADPLCEYPTVQLFGAIAAYAESMERYIAALETEDEAAVAK